MPTRPRPHRGNPIAAIAASSIAVCFARLAAGVFTICLVQGRAQAEPASPSSPPATAVTPTCSEGAPQSLKTVACELRERLGGATVKTLVVAAPVQELRAGTDGDKLAVRLAQMVAAELGKAASAAAQTATPAKALSMATTATRLVYLAPRVSGASLEVVADVFAVPRNFWARARGAEPSPVAHAFVRQPLDAELRSFLPRPPLVVSRVDKAKHTVQAPVALACGDIDGDQGLELLVVGRHELALGRLRGGRLVRKASARWSDLSPIAPAPSRQVMAGAWLQPGRALVGTSDRAHALALDPELRLTETLGHLVPWGPARCAGVDSMAMSPEPIPCWSELSPRAHGAETEGVHAIAGALVTTAHGPPLTVRATVDAGIERATLSDDGGRRVSVAGVGAQIALGDLDGDGEPELVTSRATLDPSKDALDVRTWTSHGQLVRRFSLATPNGIAALAVCPAEDLGLAPIIVATADELWVVR